MVIDLAIEDDDGIALLIEDRLAAGGEIDDGEAAHAQAGGAVDVLPPLSRRAWMVASHMALISAPATAAPLSRL